MAETSPLLRMTGIGKRFGATQALRRVALELDAGQILALVGENGAGKSTLLKILSGAIRPDAGHIEINGRPEVFRHPQQARAAGVATIYQELNLAPDLSVEDNIMLGQEASRCGLLRRSAQRPRVLEVLHMLGHGELRPETPVRQLPVGAQQVVEIARALVSQAKILLLDEPTSSLTRQDVGRLFDVLRRLRDSGIGIVYISHFLDEVREICDRFAVLRDGEVAGGGSLAGVTEEQIVSMMVGRNVDELFPRIAHQPGEVVLSIAGLSGRKAPRDVSLEVRRGEILGIAGLVGAGRTELLRCLLALDPVRSGTVKVCGQIRRSCPRDRLAAGLGLVSEDRKSEGLAQERSIADNLTYSRLAPYQRFGILRLARRAAAVRHWADALRIKARGVDQPVSELSGGNQQKVALARVLHQQADVLLLDEPTRGIDVGTKAEIYRLIGQLAAQGKAILFVSSYFHELLAVCDRIALMARGRVREVRPAAEWTEETLMQGATKGSETP